MILDGDFIRINTFSNNEEKKAVVSLHLLAGGPVTISDQYNTIGNDLWAYQNTELLELHQDGFVAKPLSIDPNNEASQTWKGQLSNGDWVVGFFNRETTTKARSIKFSDLGITGNASVRDIWKHEDLGNMATYSVQVPSHGCVVVRISTKNTSRVSSPVFSVDAGTYSSAQTITLNSATAGATIYYTTDGSAPTTASSVYTSPIVISSTSTIKAFAKKAGSVDSPVATANYTIKISTLPAEWLSKDIGSIFPAGETSYSLANGIFTNKGAGADIEGSADAFSFIYKEVTGNVTLTARINTLTKTNDWAKAGVMIRENLNANSSNAFTALTPVNGISFQKRITHGGNTTATIVSGLNIPHWVRIKRIGSTFSSFYSADGLSWTKIGADVTITMNAKVLVGLPITSHSNGTLGTATFSNVTIE